MHEPAATLPAPWSKIDALLLHLHRFDWLLYLDGDALVANPAICLESFLDDAFDVVMAEDWGGYNTGAFFVRNSSFSHELLRAMADAATGKLDLARREPWRRRGREKRKIARTPKLSNGKPGIVCNER